MGHFIVIIVEIIRGKVGFAMPTRHATRPFVTVAKAAGHGAGSLCAVAALSGGHALGHIVEACHEAFFVAVVSVSGIHRIVHFIHPSFLCFGT
jgi:hypothetical protein